MCGACKSGGRRVLNGLGVSGVGGGWTHYDATIMPVLGRSNSLGSLRDAIAKQPPMDPLVKTVLVIAVVAVGLVAMAKVAAE